jgi:hypothetical protein
VAEKKSSTPQITASSLTPQITASSPVMKPTRSLRARHLPPEPRRACLADCRARLANPRPPRRGRRARLADPRRARLAGLAAPSPPRRPHPRSAPGRPRRCPRPSPQVPPAGRRGRCPVRLAAAQEAREAPR